MYRDDYARAGMLMLPCNDVRGDIAFRRILTFSLTLVPVSLIPSLLGMTGRLYFISAIVLGFGFLYFAFQASQYRTAVRARALLHASVIYLPLLYAAMMVTSSASAATMLPLDLGMLAEPYGGNCLHGLKEAA